MNAEKNDVDISKLFNWGGKVTITDDYGNPLMDVYIRLVGDADLGRARVFGLRSSAELRKKLRTEGSDERVGLLPDYSLLEIENIVEMVIASKMREYADKLSEKLNFPFPKEPKSDSSLEEQEAYQKEVDEWPTKRTELLSKELDQFIEKERKSLLKKSRDELGKTLDESLIDNLCQEEMYVKFMAMCLYLGTFKDEKYSRKVFHSAEEFENLPSAIKTQFLNFYNSLDIRAEELKN